MEKVDEQVELQDSSMGSHPTGAISFALPFKGIAATGWLNDLGMKKKMERMGKSSKKSCRIIIRITRISFNLRNCV